MLWIDKIWETPYISQVHCILNSGHGAQGHRSNNYLPLGPILDGL